MGLEERLIEEMKQAMRSGDKLRLSTIRMIRAALKNKEIEVRKKLDEEEIFRVIQGMLRRGEESVEQ
ncbi:MAG: GatB/YqeY domain-containing protein, partial [Desulfobacterales bacterium]|nr:GatB/YqeY domain-containing protein [Desulfobacterales bacterium]